MKVAYLAESPADQAALTIFTEAILGRQTQLVNHTDLRSRGWPAVKNVLRSVLLELHYHTDAEGFVLIVDSNGSTAHSASHAHVPEPKCRLCQLRRIVSEAQQQFRPRQNQAPLKIALGLSVPAIEAWLLCGIDPHVSEAAWINGLKTGQMPYTKEALKDRLYGNSRPSLPVETEVMKTSATRLAGDLNILEKLFPVGFGNLRTDLKNW